MTPHDYISQNDQFLLTSLPFNKRPVLPELFNAIKVFKTKVMRSQRNYKDNAKVKYCRLVASRRLFISKTKTSAKV